MDIKEELYQVIVDFNDTNPHNYCVPLEFLDHLEKYGYVVVSKEDLDAIR